MDPQTADLRRDCSSAIATELRRAMTRRGVTVSELALVSGIPRGRIYDWLGPAVRRLPAPASLAALAEVLDWPALVLVSVRLRTQECDECGRTFLRRFIGPGQRYCSRQCQVRVGQRISYGGRRRPAALAVHDLDRARAAIARFCAGCSPEGICRESGCELRPVSPLPFIPFASLRLPPQTTRVARPQRGSRTVRPAVEAPASR